MRLPRGLVPLTLFSLLICLGATAQAGGDDLAVSSVSPLPAVTPSLQLPVDSPPPAENFSPQDPLPTLEPPATPEVDRALLLSVDPEEEEAAEGETVDAPAAAVGPLSPDGENLGEEEGEVAPLDPETLEETRVLTDETAVPPDDEGVTVPVTVVFDFPVVENQKVQYYIDYYTTGEGRKVFSRWLERSTRYLPYMREVFAAHGLPQDLVYLSIVESGLNPKAYSWAHASGPWQFIAGTGKIFGLENNYWWDERRDFAKSTEAAARYLKELHDLFDGEWYLAVAAYNAGAGKVMNAIRKTGSRDFWQLAHSKYLKEETKNYVPKLLAVLLIAKQPEKYGFTEMEYLAPLSCETVTLAGTTDIEVIARLADATYEQIKALNPELKRWCTPPKLDNYEIKLPLGKKEAFLAAYDALPPGERTSYTYHQLQKGETLKGLAKLYKTDLKSLLAVNSIVNPKSVRPGKGLVIPVRPGAQPIPVEDLREDPVQLKLARIKTYKVKKGDTLGKIARRTGVSEKSLRAWNGLGTKGVLRIGQTLRLGPGQKKGGEVRVAANRTPASSRSVAKKSPSKGARIVYKVRKGDTLERIARQYDVSAREIRSWNDLPPRHVLQPGDNLTLRVQGRRGG